MIRNRRDDREPFPIIRNQMGSLPDPDSNVLLPISEQYDIECPCSICKQIVGSQINLKEKLAFKYHHVLFAQSIIQNKRRKHYHIHKNCKQFQIRRPLK